MPKDFLKCVRQGGRVRTIKPRGYDDPLYINICYDRSGKSHHGEKKYRKGKKSKSKKKSKKKKSKKKKKNTKRSSKRHTK